MIRSEAKRTGYTFLTMKNEALEGMRIQLEPANTADGPPWPAAPPAKDDDMDVHVGLHSEMLTPRRQRPNMEPGLVVGRLYLDGCLASSGTGTLSNAESQETRLGSMLDPTSQFNKTSGTTSVGYNRGGGIIRRGVTALEPASSSSGYDSQLPRSFLPLTEDWDLPLVDEWALVTDDEEDENINNDDDEPGP